MNESSGVSASESVILNAGGIETVQILCDVSVKVTGTQYMRRVTGDAANSAYGT